MVENLNGAYFPQLAVNTNPSLSESAALAMVLAKYPNVEFAWQNEAEESLLKLIENNPQATYFPHGHLTIISKDYSLKQEDFRLAYKFDVYVTEPLSREMVYIDAITGEILFNNPLIHTTDVKGSGKTRYSGTQTITCDSINSDSFVLRSTSRGQGVHTYNAKLTTKLDTNRRFTNKTTSWDLNNAAQDEVALDVQWGMEKSYDFYKEVLGINSINDSGYKIIGLVHYRNKYNNASWNNGFLNFGDGDGTTFKPLTSIDICGHELTHGVTQKMAGLIYKNESGGLNESFSDIFGKCIEHYAIPDSFTWKIGEKVQFSGNFLRSMSNPHLKQNPKYYDGLYFIDSGMPQDNGGVHVNSGVQNYWFYLLCEGGSGNREKDNKPFTVKPIGWEKATEIAFSTLSNYLTPNSDFIDASHFSHLSSQNMFGISSDEADQVQMAWYAVGLAAMPGSGISAPEKISNSISVFPNPAENILKVNIKYNKVARANLTDISGRIIHSINIYDGAEINISDLDNGIYLLQFEDGSCIKFAKI
jgi:bacillolysin